ncbi:MarR family transcriptional regulator [Neisseria animalis]|nr:MarR family transcriptional regulator [Neisseria animalis]
MKEISRLMLKIQLLYSQWAKQQGLNYNTLAVLFTLATKGRCTQKQIGELWHLPKQTVFSICRQLAEKGHIGFEQNTNGDGREKIMFLTESGTAYAKPVAEKMQAMETLALQRFGADNSRQLLAQMARLADILAETMHNRHMMADDTDR